MPSDMVCVDRSKRLRRLSKLVLRADPSARLPPALHEFPNSDLGRGASRGLMLSSTFRDAKCAPHCHTLRGVSQRRSPVCLGRSPTTSVPQLCGSESLLDHTAKLNCSCDCSRSPTRRTDPHRERAGDERRCRSGPRPTGVSIVFRTLSHRPHRCFPKPDVSILVFPRGTLRLRRRRRHGDAGLWADKWSGIWTRESEALDPFMRALMPYDGTRASTSLEPA